MSLRVFCAMRSTILLIMHYESLKDEKLGKFCPHLFSNVLLPTDFSEAGMTVINRVKDYKLTNNVELINVVAKGESAKEKRRE